MIPLKLRTALLLLWSGVAVGVALLTDIFAVAMAGYTVAALTLLHILRSRKGRPLILGTASTDPLTGASARVAFPDLLRDAIGRAGADGQFGLLLVDLERFGSVNSMWGHESGDAVLREAVDRLRRLVGPDAALARLSGDEFAAIVPGEGNPRNLKQLAERIIAALSEPFLVGTASVVLGARIGIAVYPVNADSGDLLFRAAALALERAKRQGQQKLRFFDTELEKEVRRRTTRDRDLRNALANNEFVLFYQPQMDLTTGALRGYEALIRWERPGEGIVPPMEFIPVAEETGLIRPLGEWVLRRACEDAATWLDGGTVAVNFSPVQFRYPGVEEMIATVLRETGLPAERLEIEITESVFLNHSAEVMTTLRAIKALGVRIAMDDFGTGYSSLGYLARFPFDKIKIDRSFVAQLAEDPDIATIVASIVGLGRSLSVDITAEGVETEEQVTLLKATGCRIVQGFLFGAPRRSTTAPAAGEAPSDAVRRS